MQGMHPYTFYPSKLNTPAKYIVAAHSTTELVVFFKSAAAVGMDHSRKIIGFLLLQPALRQKRVEKFRIGHE